MNVLMLYYLYMRAIQITFDERLLSRLDADGEVRREGRSAVLRRAAEMYLAHRRGQRLADAYRAAYAEGGTDVDLTGWEDEGEWPDA
jgi:metal-responsive CopG/Arc/MetJ family transcriptional regulator